MIPTPETRYYRLDWWCGLIICACSALMMDPLWKWMLVTTIFSIGQGLMRPDRTESR